MIIGNTLTSLKMQYEYEPIIELKEKTLNPDFYIPEKNIYIEYYGMRSVDSYDQKYRKKKLIYKKRNLKVISLFPQNIKNPKKLRKLLYGKIKRMSK